MFSEKFPRNSDTQLPFNYHLNYFVTWLARVIGRKIIFSWYFKRFSDTDLFRERRHRCQVEGIYLFGMSRLEFAFLCLFGSLEKFSIRLFEKGWKFVFYKAILSWKSAIEKYRAMSKYSWTTYKVFKSILEVLNSDYYKTYKVQKSLYLK